MAQQRQSLRIAAESPEILAQPVEPRHQIHQSVIALRAPFRAGFQEACRFNVLELGEASSFTPGRNGSMGGDVWIFDAA